MIQGRSGVSFIELLVVLTILAIATTTAGPALVKSVDKFALNSTGRRLAGAFRTAQIEAKLGQREVLGTLSDGEFIFVKGDKQVGSLKLPANLQVLPEGDVAYTFLTTGQILGPPRLELTVDARYRGWIVLGPGAGTVRFQEE